MMKAKFFLSVTLCMLLSCAVFGSRQMEKLNRGLVAVKVANGVYLSWRLLATDSYHVKFNVYRDGALITTIAADAATNYTDLAGTTSSAYLVKPVWGSKEIDESEMPVTPWASDGLTIQLQRPPAGKTPPNVEHDGTSSGTAVSYPDGQDYTYTPNDCSVADLDGDGEYEIIVKWYPSNAKDNSQTGITGNVYLDAYKLNGTRLWRIDLGKNIRAGAHYTQFMVYDFDGDGKAEMVVKTAPGTIDGQGNNVIMGSDSPSADYRNLNISTGGNNRTGFVMSGPEYLTLFDGETGAELHTIAYKPNRSGTWGDNYGNRVDRFLAAVAYLDGVKPSVVMCRGYYTRATLAAYDVVNKQLVEKWFYDSGSTAGVGAYGEGAHSLAVADVNGDGKDDIIYGSAVINSNGTLLYRTGRGHGDALHVGKMIPDSEGLQIWMVHEDKAAPYGYELRDAKTGAVIWGAQTGTDVGRGMAADIDSRYRGYEMWSSGVGGTYGHAGNQISTSRPSNNFRIYWDGDVQDELLDGTTISKWNSNNGNPNVGGSSSNLRSFSGMSSINGTKSNPCLSADILGDWREEVIYYNTSEPSKITIFTTTIPTANRFRTLMSDHVYRLSIAWQNVAYNQPPHLGFYLRDSVERLQALPIDEPCEGDDCPCEGDDCPCVGDDCPCEGDDCPCVGDDCPITNVADNRWANLLLYPNPSADAATLSGLEGGETISIVDLRGQLQRRIENNGESVVINHLPQGIYMVVVAKNNHTKTLKLVVAGK